LLGDCAGLRWPLPVVAIALLRLGGRCVLSPSAPSGVEEFTDYSRVIVLRSNFDRALAAFRLTGLTARAAPIDTWASSKAMRSRALLDAGIKHFKAALASSQVSDPDPSPRCSIFFWHSIAVASVPFSSLVLGHPILGFSRCRLLADAGASGGSN
jgi:hypothetical protein